jgi:hypothetical protein
MLRYLYAITIATAAAVLFVAVDTLEPNPRFARVLQVLIVVVAAAAVIDQLMP